MYEDSNLIYKTLVTAEICIKKLNVCKGKTSQLFLLATQILSFKEPKAILLVQNCLPKEHTVVSVKAFKTGDQPPSVEYNQNFTSS